MSLSRPPIRPAAERNIASYAVDLAAALGARAAFTLTGGMAMYLNRAVSTHPGLKAVYNQHEQACAAGAEGYAKASDYRVAGLAVVTAGPGVTNTITSLCSAYGDSAPVIVLAGQVKTADIDSFGTRTHGAQEVRSRELVSPCVKRFVRITAEGFRDELIETFAEAFTGRPGPVFVELPLDVQNLVIDYAPEEVLAAVQAVRDRIAGDAAPSDAASLTQALTWLLGGRRPLVYVGNGCRVAGAGKAVRTFLEAHGVPAVFSWLSTDQLPAAHPLNFGAPGGLAPLSANQILYQADRVLFLGARLDLGTTAFQRHDFGAQAERLMVDVDAGELAKFAGLADTRTLRADLSALAAAVQSTGAVSNVMAADWRAWCEARRAEYLADERQRLTVDSLNVFGVAQRLSAWSAGKVFVPTGSGSAIEAFIRFFAPGEDSRCFFGASLGAMGLGLPQAVGAAFATDRRVICVEADGGLMLNVQELATLSHYAPKGFVLFVLNNDGYTSIHASQNRHFGAVGGAGRESGVFIPDYGQVAPAFGLRYARVDSLAALDDLLPTLDAEAPPIFVDLIIDRAESLGPTVKTVISPEGKLSSTPLSDIQW
ncbi:thiamine pyrophosphate-binding protein [Caulobacter sp. UNC279MFTsu5.1]|uniref:thiamine pyrophosphate-binding protein n=1 Tax=Caulobacter sp. UNC279MFTsu5.1 TaxID=1502775 RepID=UPI0008ED0812|nr:thiamine pyrophosphate-binding protein [Caulobacter sp. UNC279MFTsu5.1]SFK34678.1 acetolactate synthase-1/2/3 large subunit [Caulobacter sp. UNC279MFTsu5.1]